MYQTRKEWSEHCDRIYEFHPGYLDALKVNPQEKVRAQLIIDYVNDKFAPGASMLDAGCQDGYFSGQLQRNGWDVTGIDCCKKWVDDAKMRYPKVNFIEGFLEDQGWDQKFDLTLCTETLEHVLESECEKFMEALVKATKPGGFIFMSVPLAVHGEYPTHAKVWGRREFRKFVAQYINVIEVIELESRWNVVIGTKGISKKVTPAEMCKVMGGVA